MGVLGIGTGQGLIDFSLVPSIIALDPTVAQRYVDRSEAYLNAIYGPFDTTLPGYNDAVSLAIYRMAEILYVRSSPQYINNINSGMQKENFGSYSYDRGISSRVMQMTGVLDDEILAIMEFYTLRGKTSRITTNVFKQKDPDSNNNREFVMEDTSDDPFSEIFGAAQKDIFGEVQD